MFVSSANKVGKHMWFIEPGRSLIYIRKIRGPSIDPWGTPLIIKVTEGKDRKGQRLSGVCNVMFQKVVIPNILHLSEGSSL